MQSLDPVLHILKDPSARVLFVLDTTGSAMGSGLHEQAFEHVRMVRERVDPAGERSGIITDKFARIGPGQVDPEFLPLSASGVHHIPPGQISYAGGSVEHPLEAVSRTQLFQDYAPTHLVFIGDLMDVAPKVENMALPLDKALFMMSDATPESLEQSAAYYKHAGRVVPLFMPDELRKLHACEDAEALSSETPEVQPARSRPRF